MNALNVDPWQAGATAMRFLAKPDGDLPEQFRAQRGEAWNIWNFELLPRQDAWRGSVGVRNHLRPTWERWFGEVMAAATAYFNERSHLTPSGFDVNQAQMSAARAIAKVSPNYPGSEIATLPDVKPGLTGALAGGGGAILFVLALLWFTRK